MFLPSPVAMRRKVLLLVLFLAGPAAGQDAALRGHLDKVKNGSPQERTQALEAIGRLGSAGASAIPVLLEKMEYLLDEPGTPDQIAETLARIGPAAVDPLVKSLRKKPNAKTARALGLIGSGAVAAVPALRGYLKTAKEPEEWALAAWALGRIGPKAAAAVPHLVETARRQADPTPAVVALAGIGPAAKEAAPYLVGLIQAKEEGRYSLRIEALKTLQALDVPPDQVLPFLLRQLTDGERPVPDPVLLALTRTGPPPKDIHEKLHHAMRSGNPKMRLLAARILGKAMPNDPSVVSVLLESLQEQDAALRLQAVRALGEVRPRDEAVPLYLEKAMRDADPEVRRAAAAALKVLRK